MEQLSQAIGHNKGSFIGTAAAFALGFIGKWTLSDTALIMGILSGAATFLYTLWRWYQEYLIRKNSKHKKAKHENFV